ncbi:2,3-diketo-5-methylthio-1-phosphopentane phosphatase [Rhizoclosmatium globosum]|uniref:2,3-diketo-5-methylthio-1-phosphopentane phosphatase n=1 Tax=Rhizoclosmatium globosum TaxID=329046 RepID=A0A1Y2BD78_9FUNG|nr:2,3-diketo-5-methylthio-1-phosphopentane phosphatase [Rhizoclosmatium globosum]|eukprot:ORY32773.1 2,3-diketo-5-methylthio-1-phosphopentane phosphatase [Rhizoclosmatium globosum]
MPKVEKKAAKPSPVSPPAKDAKKGVKAEKAEKKTAEKVEKAPVPEFSCVLTDIEGTTTSISFVHEVLFPYARDNALDFLTKHWDSDKNLKPLLDALKSQADEDKKAGRKDVPDLNAKKKDALIKNYVAYIHSMIKEDRKIGALKNFQGYIWKFAYEDGSVKGHVYPDVLPSLKKFTENGIPVYIYSSGSISAQKLIFGFSEAGDLLPYFKGHFDTTSGSKLEKKSYITIANEIGIEPSKILFLSDNVKEIEAANEAGYITCILFRPGNAELVPAPVKSKYTLPNKDATKIPVAKDFNQLFSFNDYFKFDKSARAHAKSDALAEQLAQKAEADKKREEIKAKHLKQIEEAKKGSKRTAQIEAREAKRQAAAEKAKEPVSKSSPKKRKADEAEAEEAKVVEEEKPPKKAKNSSTPKKANKDEEEKPVKKVKESPTPKKVNKKEDKAVPKKGKVGKK